MLIEETNENLNCANTLVTAEMSEESAVWYAVHTRSRCEKKVNGELRAHGIEIYLPLYPVRRRWSDRSVEIGRAHV